MNLLVLVSGWFVAGGVIVMALIAFGRHERLSDQVFHLSQENRSLAIKLQREQDAHAETEKESAEVYARLEKAEKALAKLQHRKITHA